MDEAKRRPQESSLEMRVGRDAWERFQRTIDEILGTPENGQSRKKPATKNGD